MYDKASQLAKKKRAVPVIMSGVRHCKKMAALVGSFVKR
jgi:hypothetical protein